jgi:hypothetical protein
MKELGRLDPMDRRILRALSLHEHLSTLQLWYELIGNENRNGWVTPKSKVLLALRRMLGQSPVEPEPKDPTPS